MLEDVDPGVVTGGLDRRVALALARYAVLYPVMAVGGVALVSWWAGVEFGTAGFAAFVVAVVATGLGADATSPSKRALRSDGPSVDEQSDPAAYWTDSFVLRMALFDL
jgi:hypothetical protein